MASSLRKIKSARANSAKSRGPVTSQGKQASSLNAVRHALLASKTVVLTHESSNRFQQVFQSYIDQFQPSGDVEMDLVEEMAVAKWQQRRGWSIQTATLDNRMDAQDEDLKRKFERVDERTRLAVAFSAEANDSKALALLLRYESTHRRTYNKAFQNVLNLQAAGKLCRGRIESASKGAECPSMNLPNEPNPKIEHEDAELSLCLCGRIVHPQPADRNSTTAP